MMKAEIGMIDMCTSYVTLVRDVMRLGTEVSVRGQRTVELFDVTLSFNVPYRPMLPLGVGRNVNTRLAAVEALSLLAGSAERDLTMAAAPSYGKVLVSKDPNDFYYSAYGPRIGETIDTVVSQLAADPTTRQAVLTIWRRDDLFHDGDKPCTLTIQFLIRNERLHMVVNMRSNDVWLGLAYDAFVFSQLHWTVLNQLNVHHLPNLLLGTYRHHAASLHLYARDLDAARSMSLTAPSTVIPDLPLGLVCPRDFFPDQVADLLLHPTLDQPTDLANVVALNPWYADQMAAVHESLEVRS